MNNAVKMAVGLASLAVTVYVAGWAWRKSQDKSLNAMGDYKGRVAAHKKSLGGLKGRR